MLFAEPAHCAVNGEFSCPDEDCGGCCWLNHPGQATVWGLE